MISERTVDLRGEWRNFSESDKDRSRAAAVDDLHPELATSIRSVAFSKNKEQVDRMGKIQNRNANGPKGQDLSDAFQKIQFFANKMNLPESIMRQSRKLYTEFIEELQKDKKIPIKSKKNDPLIVSIIFHALRLCQVPRTMAEVSRLVDMDKKTLSKVINKVSAVIKNVDGMKNVEVVGAEKLVYRFCSFLQGDSGISEIEYLAGRIAEFLNPHLEGRKPETIAAVSIVTAANLLKKNVSEKDVARVANVALATIKNTHKDIEIHMSAIEAIAQSP